MSKPTFLLYFLSPYLFWSEWHWYQTHNVLILLIPKKEKKKGHSFPIFLSSFASPFLLSPFSNFQSPKNPRTKSKTKTYRIGNPNPKIKKIHSDEEEKEARDPGVD